MADVLSVVWFAAAIGGGLAVVVAAIGRGEWRRVPLVVAGGCFAVAGVLGMASIGIIFLALAAACLVVAGRTSERLRQS